MSHPESQKTVLIAGDLPGSGQTTSAEFLAHHLGLEHVYAGLIFRKYAWLWDSQFRHTSPWEEFEHRVKDPDFDLSDHPFNQSDFNEDVLHDFHIAMQQHGDIDFWDHTIDQETANAVIRGHVVAEGKLAPIIDHIVDMPELAHPVLRILLTVSQHASALRILKRKHDTGELPSYTQGRLNPLYWYHYAKTRRANLSRYHKHWARFSKAYGVTKDDLTGQQDINLIDTTHHSLSQIHKQLAQLSDSFFQT